jgi:N-acetylglutamate synthase-like GNAT family acetyltransferase
MKFKIRKARKSDLKEILKLDKLANKEVKWWKPLKNSEINKLLKQKNSLYVTENKNEIIGFLVGGIKKHCVELGDIFVKKEFRKKSIARKMVKKFISDWKNSKFKDIQLMSPIKLKKFYDKLNFKPSMILMKYNLK